MKPYLILLFSSYVYVALRSFQQRNVVFDSWLFVPPTSTLMAIFDVTILLTAVKNGFWSWVPMAIGGTLGCWTGMWAHKRLRNAPPNP